jgi:hypothetical protein
VPGAGEKAGLEEAKNGERQDAKNVKTTIQKVESPISMRSMAALISENLCARRFQALGAASEGHEQRAKEDKRAKDMHLSLLGGVNRMALQPRRAAGGRGRKTGLL